MKISIIYPTRNRYNLFVKSTNSLIEKCSDLNNLEILLGMDNDDIETVKLTEEYIKDKPYIKLFMFDRQYYKNLHVYVNYLSDKATGEYMILWNDDCYMESNNYDIIMDKYYDKFVIVNPLVSNDTKYTREFNGTLFPIIPKRWVEITGRWSNNGANDSWVQEIARPLNIMVNDDDIIIFHDRFDLTRENLDDVYVEAQPHRHEIYLDFISNNQVNERERDKKLISRYIEAKNVMNYFVNK